MGSSISKGRRVKSKVLPLLPAQDNEIIVADETADEKSEVLPPLRLAPSNQTILPSIAPRSKTSHMFEDSPKWSNHVTEDDDDEFQNSLEADLQLNLDQDRDEYNSEKILRHELEETKKRLEFLTKNHEELQESHSALRQELLTIRKMGIDHRMISQNTLIDDESDTPTQMAQIDQLKQDNINLSRASEQHIQLLKIKLNNQRSEYSARIFELEQKLKGFDRDAINNLSLPSLTLPQISHFEEIENLKKQLSLKNEVIKDLSMKLMEVQRSAT